MNLQNENIHIIDSIHVKNLFTKILSSMYKIVYPLRVHIKNEKKAHTHTHSISTHQVNGLILAEFV